MKEFKRTCKGNNPFFYKHSKPIIVNLENKFYQYKLYVEFWETWSRFVGRIFEICNFENIKNGGKSFKMKNILFDISQGRLVKCVCHPNIQLRKCDTEDRFSFELHPVISQF